MVGFSAIKTLTVMTFSSMYRFKFLALHLLVMKSLNELKILNKQKHFCRESTYVASCFGHIYELESSTRRETELQYSITTPRSSPHFYNPRKLLMLW